MNDMMAQDQVGSGQAAATAGAAVLTATEVVKSYGPRKALDGVSLTIHAGEFVALLGPNGAGKTTLFQLLTGLFVADRGSIRIGDADISRNAVPALAGLGVVFQQPTVDLDLSVFDNMRFHANLHGLGGAEAKRRIEQELSKIKMADRVDDKMRALSGGQRRRVELARALLHRPSLLLMDEPTVGLDPASRRDLLAYVLELRQERKVAVLWATHLVDEAEHADQVIVLHQGRILKKGTSAMLIKETGAANLHDAFVKLTGTTE
jgi:ABC-2 type transport system ATP-binding protein